MTFWTPEFQERGAEAVPSEDPRLLSGNFGLLKRQQLLRSFLCVCVLSCSLLVRLVHQDSSDIPFPSWNL